MSATKYGIAALQMEAENVAASAQGERNNRLNEAAFSLGQLVAGGEIDRPDVEMVLIQAAVAGGLPEHEARATVLSGLAAGAKQPRRAPERDPASVRREDLPSMQAATQAPPVWQPDQDQAPPTGAWQERAQALVAWAAPLVHARQHWLSARGITPETAQAFFLGDNQGENGRDIYRARSAWGLPDVLKDDGRPKKLWIPRGLVIPLLHPDGRVLRIRIRRDEGEPRYYVLPGSSMAPLVLDNSRPVTVVLESELDGVLIQQEAADLVNVMALGSSSRKPPATAHRLLARSGKILCMFDADEAGASALAWWMDHYAQARPLFVPAPHKDVGELAASGAPVRTWLEDNLPTGLRIMARSKPSVWTPPPANRHPEPVKTTPWNDSKPPRAGATRPPMDAGAQNIDEAREAGAASEHPRDAAARRLRALLARCKTGKLYAAINDQDGMGGRGCAKCGFGGTSCGLEYEVGSLVCNDDWVQDVIYESGGRVPGPVFTAKSTRGSK